MISLMRLEEYFVPGFSFATRIPNDEKDVCDSEMDHTLDTEIEFKVLENRSSLKFLVPLKIKVKTNPDSQHFLESLFFEIHGVFSFPENTPLAEIRKYVPLLCLTNLYGIARGIISQSTSLSPNGPFILPLVNMKQIAEEYITKHFIAEDQAASEKNDASPIDGDRKVTAKSKAIANKKPVICKPEAQVKEPKTSSSKRAKNKMRSDT